MQLICPICAAHLHPNADDTQLACTAGHSFDRARQGYWNLLPVQKKRSKDPGDNPEMVRARERFLDSGFYQPISDALNRLVATQLSDLTPEPVFQLADLGCGEGYYTARLMEHLAQQKIPTELLGLDISKHAIKAACRRSKAPTWVVGSSARLPVPASSLDLALILFSRVLGEPLADTLKPGGRVIIVYPGPRHLYSLRALIYDQVIDKPFDPTHSLGDKFQPLTTESINFPIRLEGRETISDLLAMTPHGQRIRTEKREAILATPCLETEVDIQLAVFQRIA